MKNKNNQPEWLSVVNSDLAAIRGEISYTNARMVKLAVATASDLGALGDHFDKELDGQLQRAKEMSALLMQATELIIDLDARVKAVEGLAAKVGLIDQQLERLEAWADATDDDVANLQDVVARTEARAHNAITKLGAPVMRPYQPNGHVAPTAVVPRPSYSYSISDKTF